MRSVFALCVALACVSCGTKEDATLAVYARNASLTKGTNAFGAKLDGGVDVVFDLGSYSGGNVTVEAISLGIYRTNTPVIDKVTIAPDAGVMFPFTLGPGDKKTVHYTFTKSQLEADDASKLCSGPVTISGTVKQAGKTDLAIDGANFAVAGCP